MVKPSAMLRVMVAAVMTLSLGLAVGAPTNASGRVFRQSDDLHIQYAGHLVVPATTRVVDLDSDGTSAATVRNLHKGGRVVVCYISAGSVERYRSDASKFPARVVGKVLDGWPDERWLDIRQLSVLLPLMMSRSCAGGWAAAMMLITITRTAYTTATSRPCHCSRSLWHTHDARFISHLN